MVPTARSDAVEDVDLDAVAPWLTWVALLTGEAGRPPLRAAAVPAWTHAAAEAAGGALIALWEAQRRARTENARLVLKVAAELQLWTELTEKKYQEKRELERQLGELQARIDRLKRVERLGGHQLPMELAGR